jgi:hypothetical protein
MEVGLTLVLIGVTVCTYAFTLELALCRPQEAKEHRLSRQH